MHGIHYTLHGIHYTLTRSYGTSSEFRPLFFEYEHIIPDTQNRPCKQSHNTIVCVVRSTLKLWGISRKKACQIRFSASILSWKPTFNAQMKTSVSGCGDNAQLCDPQDTSCDDSQCLRWVDREINVYIVDQSDGVVTARSARNDNGAWRGHIVEAPGINHLEMLRYDQIRLTFDPIFDGGNTGGQGIFQIGR